MPTEVETEVETTSPEDGAPLGQAYLVCRRDERLDVVTLDEGGEVIIGRTEGMLVIDSPRVSRRHARITLVSGRVHVEDLGSRNGTRVGSVVLRGEKREVTGGDVVKIGPLVVVIARADRVLASPAAAPSSGKRGGVDPDDEDDATGNEAVVVADPAMVALHKVIARLAPTSSTVLIVGETGTGKEVVAERIHRRSPRARGRFLRINCASLPEALLESELFGHERGAFTGADRRRTGHFEAASGGTILLDEIGEMPLGLQAKLLRVLEQRVVVRLGSSEEVPVDVRVLCATHRDLEHEVREGRFRQDLFYRISTFTLEVPPLRDRPTEVLLLADAFLRRFAGEAGKAPTTLSGEAAQCLLAHGWPGNVRELRNAMEHAVVMAESVVGPEHLPKALRGTVVKEAPPMRDAMEDMERSTIATALAAEGNNRTRAAKRLGISRRALIYKMIKYGLRD